MYVGVVIRVYFAVVGASLVVFEAKVVAVVPVVIGVDDVSSAVVGNSAVVFGAGVLVDSVVFASIASVIVAVCVEDSELE